MRAELFLNPVEVKDFCQGEFLHYNPASRIETVTSDSRDLGQKNLFIPLPGDKFDGHNFIKDLVVDQKIDCFLSMQSNFQGIAQEKNVTAIKCADTYEALNCLAAAHRTKMDLKVIGITGTNGKTTVKELVAHILGGQYQVLKNEKNYNNNIGVAFTLLGLRDVHEVAVVEMGMNHLGEIKRLSEMAKPDLGLITNIGPGHLEFLGSIENVALAKREILSGMTPGTKLFINQQVPYLNLIKEAADLGEIEIKTFGTNSSADIFPDRYHLSEKGLSLEYQDQLFELPLYGIHQVYNLMASLALAGELSVDFNLAAKKIADLDNLKGRSQIIEKDYLVINDTYNSNPLSVELALDSLQKIFSQHRKIVVLGDMKELGPESSNWHYQIGQRVAEAKFDLFLSWGELSSSYRQGALEAGLPEEKVYNFEKKSELISFLQKNIKPLDVILVKGSRSTKMEEIVEGIT